MAFEIFESKRRVIIDKPFVSILKQGSLGFNQASCRDFLVKFKYAILMFDREQKKIGIRLTNEFSDHAYPIRFYRNRTLANISAISYLKYYKVDYKKTKAFQCSFDKKNSTIEINLSENELG